MSVIRVTKIATVPRQMRFVLAVASALDAYQALKTVSLKAATGRTASPVTSLWRTDVLGFGGERCAIEFLRHFG